MTRQRGPYDGDDYSALETRYRAATGHELDRDSYDSLRQHPPLQRRAVTSYSSMAGAEVARREELAHHAPRLVAGGYLLFHGYNEDDPGVRVVVDELLADPADRLIARVGGLVAMTTFASTSFPTPNDRGATRLSGLR